jgi:ABC-type dipeptide/oligopeptide/nickel transport system permease component
LKRGAQTLLTLLGASVLIWAMLPLAPGDPALRTLQALGVENPREAEVRAMREELQLDRPLWRQYGAWLTAALTGDLSVSWQSGRPVRDEIAKRLPATARLAFVALQLALALALLLAMTGAAFAGGWPDRAVKFLTQLGASVPAFLLGLLLLQFIVLRSGAGAARNGHPDREPRPARAQRDLSSRADNARWSAFNLISCGNVCANGNARISGSR